MVPNRKNRNEFVESFAKGLTVLRVFTPTERAMNLSEVASRTGQSRASARRFLLTLVALGYVRQDGDAFSLTRRIVELGHFYLVPHTLGKIAEPLLAGVVEALEETASVAVLSGNHAEIIAYARANRQMSLNLSPGDRLPLFSSAQGRALLAGLSDEALERLLDAMDEGDAAAKPGRVLLSRAALREKINDARRQGYVVIDEELEIGVRSIAMPIRNGNGDVVAAMSTCAHSNRASVAALIEKFRPVLAKTVGEIEQTLAMVDDL